jgi:hypothetical protein
MSTLCLCENYWSHVTSNWSHVTSNWSHVTSNWSYVTSNWSHVTSNFHPVDILCNLLLRNIIVFTASLYIYSVRS